MKKFIIKIRLYLLALLIIGVGVGVYYFFFAKNGADQQSLVIKKADFVQTVTIAGKVTPAQSVELAFNRGGKISSVLVSEGQRVGAGQLIASLDAREAELALSSARLELNKMIENKNSNNPSGSAKNYEDTLANINKTFLDLPNIMDGVESILLDYQTSSYKSNLPNNTSREYFNQAVTSFYASKEKYQKVLGDYRSLKRPLANESIVATNEEAYVLLQDLSQMIKTTENYLNYTYDRYSKNSRPTELVTDRENIGSWSQTVNSDLALVGGGRETLKNSVLDIEGQKLTVDQKANEYSQYFLHAPFSGLVTRVEAKVGEIVSSGQMAVMMINDDLFQVESYVPEVSIAGLKVGNPAQVTVDAYGPETFFDAKIIYIDPAETIRDGVSTYKIKLQFNSRDERIRSGMTANAVITSESKSNIISVPASAIATGPNGEKTVQVKSADSLVKRTVTVGSIGALGQTEILSGLKEGEEIVFGLQTK